MSKSKFKAVKKADAPVTAEQTTPVVTAPSVAPASGRTIVQIARELKITPQNARRVARKQRVRSRPQRERTALGTVA
jgi:hypothetical protein